MHQVLSYETAVRANSSSREYVTKRTCASLLLTIGFFMLISGGRQSRICRVAHANESFVLASQAICWAISWRSASITYASCWQKSQLRQARPPGRTGSDTCSWMAWIMAICRNYAPTRSTRTNCWPQHRCWISCYSRTRANAIWPRPWTRRSLTSTSAAPRIYRPIRTSRPASSLSSW